MVFAGWAVLCVGGLILVCNLAALGAGIVRVPALLFGVAILVLGIVLVDQGERRRKKKLIDSNDDGQG